MGEGGAGIKRRLVAEQNSYMVEMGVGVIIGKFVSHCSPYS